MNEAFTHICPVCKKEWYSTWTPDASRICPDCPKAEAPKPEPQPKTEAQKAEEQETLRVYLEPLQGLRILAPREWPAGGKVVSFPRRRRASSSSPVKRGDPREPLKVGEGVVAKSDVSPSPVGTPGRDVMPMGTEGRVIGQWHFGDFHEFVQVAFKDGSVISFVDEARNFIRKAWVAEQKANSKAGTWFLGRTWLPAPSCAPREREGALQVGDKVRLLKTVEQPFSGRLLKTVERPRLGGPYVPVRTLGHVSCTWWRTFGLPDAARVVKVAFVNGRFHHFIEASSGDPDDILDTLTDNLKRLL